MNLIKFPRPDNERPPAPPSRKPADWFTQYTNIVTADRMANNQLDPNLLNLLAQCADIAAVKP